MTKHKVGYESYIESKFFAATAVNLEHSGHLVQVGVLVWDSQ